VCPDVAALEAVEPVAQRISDSIGPLEAAEGRLELGASVGLAWTDGGNESPDVLTARADQAMYEAKMNGSAVVVAAPA
jgi:PleD family two-component response regulator